MSNRKCERKICYQMKMYRMKMVIEIEKSFKMNYGAPGEKRKKKKKATPEYIARQNEWNAEKKLRRILNLNFTDNDWHLIPTFVKEKRPKSRDELRVIIDKFLDAMRKAYKRLSKKLKYVCAFEMGTHGAPHFHLVINDVNKNGINTRKLVKKIWGYGKAKLIALNTEGDYSALAKYIIKETKTDFRNEDAVFRARYTCSKGLIKVEPEVEELGRYWSKRTREITVPDDLADQGWYLDKDSIVDGINQVTGRHYQYYRLLLDQDVNKKWIKQQSGKNTRCKRGG